MIRSGKKWGKKTASLVTSIAMAFSLMGPLGAYVYAEGEVVFKIQQGGVFNGMPLFDGNPEHLDAYVDSYFDYTGLEGPAVYVTGSRNHYTLTRGVNAGRVIPGALSAADNVQGVSTDFPALVGMGQTWNKELLAEIGGVMGKEKISMLKVKQGESNIHGGNNASLSVAFTVVSDMRINPLSGRFDEGFSEDPYMAGVMIDEMATGLSGIDQPDSDGGFWMRAAVGTKHYSVYNSQWFRQTGNNSASARSIFEYQTRSPLKALQSGAVAGVMTSYGRTNGVPNILSSMQIYASQNAKYGAYSSPDFNGDAIVSNPNQLGNGYDDRYAVDRTHATVLMALALANAGRPSGTTPADVPDLVNLVEQGAYGITEEDLIAAARPHVNQLVRLGIFNETDEQGIPFDYPFAQDAKDVRTTPADDFRVPEHQAVAMKAAQESIVLLKNEDGVLPLQKQRKAAVSGLYADARFKTTYSVGTTPAIENSGLSPLLSIIKANGASNVDYTPGSRVIALTSAANGEVVTADAAHPGALTEGSQLITADKEQDLEDPAQLFRVFDWGQGAASLQSLLNGRWVTSPTANSAAVGNTDVTKLNLTDNDWDLAQMLGDTSVIPPRLRIEDNADGTVSLIANGYRTGFSGDFTNWYYANGRFIAAENGELKTAAAPLIDRSGAASRSAAVKFEETVVREAGEEAAARATVDDYAIVFVGAVPRHSAGEGNDRSSLDMGEDDYKLVERVSSAFAAEGKKTIVVVKTSFPVAMEEIENNPNVSAIVYQPYGGQYDSLALAQVLYGDYAPTGRLTSTWYVNDEALPAINKYVIPEGNPATVASVDPRFTVDMTNSDAEEAGLTYMYTSKPVTYPFGYGLSYSEFSYSNVQTPATVSGDAPFQMTVDVRNDGEIATSEVVQVYVRNPQSAYGTHAPQKQLAAFEKVALAAGESKTVTLTIDPQDFAIWDVNRAGFIVESGAYTVQVAASSADVRAERTVQVQGQTLAQLSPAQPFNVFDHAFAANEVIYHEVSKARTAAKLKEKKVVGGYHAVRSKQNGSWVAVPKVNLNGATKVTARVASDAAGGVITLHAGSPQSAPIAVIDVPTTAPTSYKIDNANVQVQELGYSEVTAELSTSNLSGVHDLYVVFKAPDLRIDSLAFAVKEEPNPSNPGTSNPWPIITTPTTPTTPEQPETETPSEPEANKIIVQQGGAEDRAKVAKVAAAGIRVLGQPVHLSIEAHDGAYVPVELELGRLTGALPTTLARVGEDGKLTPVPSQLSVDANGRTIARAWVVADGTYIAVRSARAFVDVPAGAWYADSIKAANGLLLIQGVSDTRMEPGAQTTAAQTLIVALHVLGITPESAESDQKWYDAVLRTAADVGLIDTASIAADAPMSRAAMAEALTRALAYAGVADTLDAATVDRLLSGYRDATDLRPEERAAMALAIHHGIFQGTPQGLLHGASTLTRAELATVALRTRAALEELLGQ